MEPIVWPIRDLPLNYSFHLRMKLYEAFAYWHNANLRDGIPAFKYLSRKDLKSDGEKKSFQSCAVAVKAIEEQMESLKSENEPAYLECQSRTDQFMFAAKHLIWNIWGKNSIVVEKVACSTVDKLKSEYNVSIGKRKRKYSGFHERDCKK